MKTEFNGFDKFAKSKLFRDIVKKEAANLDIAFAFFYGSRNYNLETGKSDYDFFLAYHPSFENFYVNRFERFSVIENKYDYFVAPFHEYLRHAMNGNVKFIEPLICGTVFEIGRQENKGSRDNFKALGLKGFGSGNRLKIFVEKVKKFILINRKKNFDAMTGIIKNKKLNVAKGLYTSNTLIYKETHGYDIKEAINSLRIGFLLENYLEKGLFAFNVKGNPAYEVFENYLSGINGKVISREKYLEIAGERLDNLAVLYKSMPQPDEDTESLRRNTEADIKNELMHICKENACFAKNVPDML